MRLASVCLVSCLVAAGVAVTGGCDLGKVTVGTTAKVLERAQPSLQQESDYEMARQAIPGALKTIEGFWVVDPENQRLINILTEGYCQYGTAFVEDDWEVAKFKKDLNDIAYHNERATHIFTRCLNYALRTLGERWQKEIFGEPDKVAKLIKETGSDQRTEMMFVGLALGSIINHNLTRVEMIAYLPTVRQIIERVIEIDVKNADRISSDPAKHCENANDSVRGDKGPSPATHPQCYAPPHNLQHAALPYVALGMIHSGASKEFGGKPDEAKAAFMSALALTDNKFLLARTLMAYRVGVQTNDRKFFHDQLKQVLETAPSVWPEQRLANEVAHRRARRYLSHEKELFQ
jgi:TRAP transporter TatT component family protein